MPTVNMKIIFLTYLIIIVEWILVSNCYLFLIIQDHLTPLRCNTYTIDGI